MLTGRNPQYVNVGYVSSWSSGYVGYTSQIPKGAGTLPQVLRANGYSTAMLGKSQVAQGHVPQTFARIVSQRKGFGVRQDLVTSVDPAAYTSETSQFSEMLNRLDFIVRH